MYNRIKHMPDWILRANRARVVRPFAVVLITYRTRTVQYQLIYVCILFWKIMLNRRLIVILWRICGLLKQIMDHNISKFVLSKLVLTGVDVNISCIHECTVRVHFIVCTCSVCLPTLWTDLYLTSKIPTIFF